MEVDDRIFIAGHKGLVGSALVRKLKSKNYSNLLLRTRSELDLTDKAAVENFFKKEKPDYVFLAAAKVGGIHANNVMPAEFIHQNLMIQNNVIHSAYQYHVKRLVFLGSSCIYPKDCIQPIRESYLLNGPLELTNRPYAIAKIAGIEMCWAYNRQYNTQFLALMPTNLYGPNDNYHIEHSHVIPALIRKFHEAKKTNKKYVELWGTGKPRREFMHADDLADACHNIIQLSKSDLDKLMPANLPPIVNVGWGEDISIKELAEKIADIIEFKGEIKFDSNNLDGTLLKKLCCEKMKSIGWLPKIELNIGLEKTYQKFLIDNKVNI